MTRGPDVYLTTGTVGGLDLGRDQGGTCPRTGVFSGRRVPVVLRRLASVTLGASLRGPPRVRPIVWGNGQCVVCRWVDVVCVVRVPPSGCCVRSVCVVCP